MRVSFLDSIWHADRTPLNTRLPEQLLPLLLGHLTFVNLKTRPLAGGEDLRSLLYGYSAESCRLPITSHSIYLAKQ